jgi:aspartyl-tRNA(Asn)/glutamyl-tRNA(Gln) amidotransferase subunit A
MTSMPRSIVDRAESCLARIERYNDSLKAFITVAAQDLRRGAADADTRAEKGAPRRPLDGCLIAVKDNIDTAGQRTTLGSRFHSDRVAEVDAEVVRRLRKAGAVVVGKSNLHELAFGATGQNPHFGACRNPWDADRICGGSSSGSAAAVAAGMCDAALGSDTGGSVRVPAALTGLAGLRPTVGRVSNRGVEPVAQQLDTVGPLAHTVAEVARIYEAIAGYDPADEYSVARPVESWSSLFPDALTGLRIGFADPETLGGVEPDVAGALRAAADTLTERGADIRRIDLSDLTPLHRELKAFVPANIAARNRQRLLEAPDTFGADVRERMQLGIRASATDYVDWLRRIERWSLKVRGMFEHVDIILTTTVGIVAPKAADVADVIGSTGELTRFTFAWSYLQLPALSVPCGFSAGGLPIGMQLVGPQWSEARLLAAGAAFQEATDFHLRRPEGFR